MLALLVPVVLGAPPDSAEEPVEPVQVSVMSWNVWGLRWPLSLDRSDRMEGVPGELEQADVVGLQEAWIGARRQIDAPLHLPQEQPGDSGLAYAGRLCGATTLALFHPFTSRTGIERFKRKGILEAEVLIEGIPVRVYNTHLQHGPASDLVRSEQIGQLLELLAAHQEPAIVMGDFNFYRDSPVDSETIERMGAAGLRDVAEELGQQQATFRFDNRYAQRSGLEEGRERFDRVYLRDGAEVAVEPMGVDVVRYRKQPLSDHQPVLAHIQLVSR